MVFIFYYFMRYFVSKLESLIQSINSLSEKITLAIEEMNNSLDELSKQNLALIYLNGKVNGLSVDDIKELMRVGNNAGKTQR